jgi:hypothetical protein
MDISNATDGAFMILYRTENLGTAFTNIVQQAGPRAVVLPFGPCLSGRISVSKSQDVVNEASRFAGTAKRIGANGADRITIRGPEQDGSSIVEFKMADGWARDLRAKGARLPGSHKVPCPAIAGCDSLAYVRILPRERRHGSC